MPSLFSKLHRFWHLARALDGFVFARERLGNPPTHLWIEPTNACNLKCIHCPTGTGLTRARGSIDFELVERLIAEAAAFRPLVYFHLGGESLLHPQLPEMIALAGRAGLSTAMFTNGTLLDRARGGALLDAGLDWIGFSFDGLDSATFERVRRGANFERVLGNILAFLRQRRERGVARPYAYMSVVDLAER
ncbi:MAG: radical SAM protein, partial [Candidatus Wallbacteria bacterium]|nr:radical SAM protein [Candidatus Wallbacteria bacterium]